MNIMDDKDMLTLELPDTDGLANADDLSAVSQAAKDVDEVSYEYSPAENEEDTPMPVLSEMDGSEFNSGAVSAPQPGANSSRRNVSGENSGQGLPQLSEMSDMPYSNNARASGGSGQTGQTGQGFSGGQNTYSPVSGNGMQGSYPSGVNAGQDTYSSANGRQGNMPGSTNYFDLLDEENELVRKGGVIAKRVATAVIVLAVLNILANLINSFDILGAASAGVDIYFAVKFMRGSHNCRFWLGVFSVLNCINSVRSYIAIHTLSELAAALGGTVGGVIVLLQIYCVISAVGMLVLAYFFFFNKAVDAYCERYSGRVD